MPDYTGGITQQEADFAARETESKKLYKPQTLAEQKQTGTAPAFENEGIVIDLVKLKSYNISMVSLVKPIPIGYTRVEGFGTQAQGQYQGGTIQVI